MDPYRFQRGYHHVKRLTRKPVDWVAWLAVIIFVVLFAAFLPIWPASWTVLPLLP